MDSSTSQDRLVHRGSSTRSQPYLKVLITHSLLVLEACNVKPTHRKSLVGNLLMLLDLTFGPSFNVKRWFTGFGELSFRWVQICIGSPIRKSSFNVENLNRIQSNLQRATTQVKMQKWLLFAGSVVGAMNQSYVYSIPDPSIPMCYKPNIYDIEGFF